MNSIPANAPPPQTAQGPGEHHHRRRGQSAQTQVEQAPGQRAAAEKVNHQPLDRIRARHIDVHNIPVRNQAAADQKYDVMHEGSIAHQRPMPCAHHKNSDAARKDAKKAGQQPTAEVLPGRHLVQSKA